MSRKKAASSSEAASGDVTRQEGPKKVSKNLSRHLAAYESSDTFSGIHRSATSRNAATKVRYCSRNSLNAWHVEA
jgi:hypothetical protein